MISMELMIDAVSRLTLWKAPKVNSLCPMISCGMPLSLCSVGNACIFQSTIVLVLDAEAMDLCSGEVYVNRH